MTKKTADSPFAAEQRKRESGAVKSLRRKGRGGGNDKRGGGCLRLSVFKSDCYCMKVCVICLFLLRFLSRDLIVTIHMTDKVTMEENDNRFFYQGKTVANIRLILYSNGHQIDPFFY